MSPDHQDTTPDGPDPSDPGPIDSGALLTPPLARPAAADFARPATADNPMLLHRTPRLTAAANILASMGVFLITQLIAGAIVARFSSARLDDGEIPKGILLAALPGGLITVAVIIWILRSQRLPLAAIGMTVRDLGVDIAVGLYATVCSFIAFFGTIGLMHVFWERGFRQLSENPENIDVMLPNAGPLALLLIMACVGFYEEVLFRGVLLTHLRRLVNSWWLAVPAGAAIFAVLHAGQQVWAATLPLFAVGVVWSVFAIWRRSLVSSMIAHWMFDYLQIIFLFFVFPLMQGSGGPTGGNSASIGPNLATGWLLW